MISSNRADDDRAMSRNEILNLGDHDYHELRRGEIRTGIVTTVQANRIVVDIGVKRDGLFRSYELQQMTGTELAQLKPGDEINVYIVNPADKHGDLIVSLHLALLEEDWRQAETYLNSDHVFEIEVADCNKGGLVVPFNNLRGFIPASQLSNFPRRLPPQEKIQRLKSYVGQSLPVRVIEVEPRRRRLVMSERLARPDWQESWRQASLANLSEGQTLRGKVTSLAKFGTFVDLGGIEGLIHISELSWRHINDPRELLSIGQEVEVHVLKIDREKQHVALSLRRLEPNPWDMVQANYSVGMKVPGTITHLVDFGAFAQIAKDIEGLIHNSEITGEPFSHPSEVLQPGEQYLLEVIHLEPERQRIGLSLKRIPEAEQKSWRASRKSGSNHSSSDGGAPDEPADGPSPPLATSKINGDSNPAAPPAPATQKAGRPEASIKDTGPDA